MSRTLRINGRAQRERDVARLIAYNLGDPTLLLSSLAITIRRSSFPMAATKANVCPTSRHSWVVPIRNICVIDVHIDPPKLESREIH